MRLWQSMVAGVDDLRLEVALKMLKSPHFNAKMNSLKEVCTQNHGNTQSFLLVLKINSSTPSDTYRCIQLIYMYSDVIQMNFFFQVCKLIEDSEKNKNTKVNLSQDAITEWLLQNKVLSIAFESMSFLFVTPQSKTMNENEN